MIGQIDHIPSIGERDRLAVQAAKADQGIDGCHLGQNLRSATGGDKPGLLKQIDRRDGIIVVQIDDAPLGYGDVQQAQVIIKHWVLRGGGANGDALGLGKAAQIGHAGHFARHRLNDYFLRNVVELLERVQPDMLRIVCRVGIDDFACSSVLHSVVSHSRTPVRFECRAFPTHRLRRNDPGRGKSS